MSVIGPRPGLWNQDILTAERDKYNANDVKPGLTGWAQINGRDELEIPVKAKLDGEYVSKMGLMIVYGDSAPYGKKKVIDEHTVPVPANFYGDSKLQADVAVRELADDKFKVIVLRPPMIYGKGSKGNYPVLAKLAKKLPVFPDVDNERSMLYVGNLCEFLCLIMLGKS